MHILQSYFRSCQALIILQGHPRQTIARSPPTDRYRPRPPACAKTRTQAPLPHRWLAVASQASHPTTDTHRRIHPILTPSLPRPRQCPALPRRSPHRERPTSSKAHKRPKPSPARCPYKPLSTSPGLPLRLASAPIGCAIVVRKSQRSLILKKTSGTLFYRAVKRLLPTPAVLFQDKTVPFLRFAQNF